MSEDSLDLVRKAVEAKEELFTVLGVDDAWHAFDDMTHVKWRLYPHTVCWHDGPDNDEYCGDIAPSEYSNAVTSDADVTAVLVNTGTGDGLRWLLFDNDKRVFDNE